jgi:hypothetical protein
MLYKPDLTVLIWRTQWVKKRDALRVNFDPKLKLEFHGTKVTNDAGLLAYRELDEVLGLTTMIESELRDNRKGKNTQHNIGIVSEAHQ